MSESPEASHDVLLVVHLLSEIAGGALESEVTLFCYLGCLLGLFDKQPASEWGYPFNATKSIAPYSSDLATALETAARAAYVESTDSGYTLTAGGKDELTFISELRRFQPRRKYLTAACNSGLVVPLPTIGAAVAAEPDLRRALALSSSRELLGDGVSALHDHFDALAEVLPDDAGLFMAAVTWVDLLAAEIDGIDGRLGEPVAGAG